MCVCVERGYEIVKALEQRSTYVSRLPEHTTVDGGGGGVDDDDCDIETDPGTPCVVMLSTTTGARRILTAFMLARAPMCAKLLLTFVIVQIPTVMSPAWLRRSQHVLTKSLFNAAPVTYVFQPCTFPT